MVDSFLWRLRRQACFDPRLKRLRGGRDNTMLWTEQTDSQLAEAAEAGAPGYGSLIEMQRRLRFAIEVQQVATKTLSRRLEWLMWMLAAFIAVVAVQVGVALFQHGS